MHGLINTPTRVSGRAAAGWYLSFLQDPLMAVLRSQAAYGPFVQLPSPRPFARHPKPFVVAIGPAFNRDVLGNPATWRTVSVTAGSGPKNSAARRLGGGIIKMTGRAHEYYRRLLLPPLQRRNVDAAGADLVRIAEEGVSAWPVGQPIDLWSYARKLMRNLAVGLLFGDDREHGYAIADAINDGIEYNWSVKVAACPVNLPGLPYHKMLRDAESLERHILDWARCKRQRLDRRDLLSIIVNSPDENGDPPSDGKIVGHTPTLVGAARETCQNALIWKLILLDQHPHVARQLAVDLRERLAGAPPALDKIVDIPLLDAVVKESMRVLPPVPQQFRVATSDTKLAGFPVGQGTRVLLSPLLTNRQPELYPEPDLFRPERWATINPSPYEYATFSSGARGCPGYWFGLCAVKVAIATILTRYRVALVPEIRVDYKVRLGLTPRRGVPAILHRPDNKFASARIQGSIRDLVRLPH
jgi:cytochrome P450